MSLRQKLLTIFAALALISLVIAGVTSWTIRQWRTTSEELEGHYQRSLLLQRVRAATFRAFKEVPDAVTGDDPNSREEFTEHIRPAEEDFTKWSELAHSDKEREEVRGVPERFDALVRDAGRAFDLVEAGRMREAFVFMEGQLEDNQFAPFQEATEQAVASDQRKRAVIRAGGAERATQRADRSFRRRLRRGLAHPASGSLPLRRSIPAAARGRRCARGRRGRRLWPPP